MDASSWTCTECSEPNRGDVPTIGLVPAHYCRQCADHCQLAAYLRGPDYARRISGRRA